MAKRVSVRANTFKVSVPGIDVDTAAEKDLLISLGARNAQIIQRGFIPMSAGAETVVPNQGISTWVFTVNFPEQSSVPDFYVTMVASGNVDNSKQNVNYPPSQEVKFETNRAIITFTGSNGSLAGSPGYLGLSYILFRKRLGS